MRMENVIVCAQTIIYIFFAKLMTTQSGVGSVLYQLWILMRAQRCHFTPFRSCRTSAPLRRTTVDYTIVAAALVCIYIQKCVYESLDVVCRHIAIRTTKQ